MMKMPALLSGDQPQGADLPWVKLDKGPGSYIFEPEDTHFLESLPTFS